MRCTTIRMPHRDHPASHLHYSIILTVVFLVCSTLCYTYSFFAVLPVAFSKAEPITVQINGLAQPPGFSPALLTVHINETVVFINHAFPARSYTLKADDGSFSSPPIPTGGQWAITFHAPGSHTYRDTSSAQTMVGELLVVDKSIQLLPTPNPFVEATVIALIKNGQSPPNTIIIATHKHSTSTSGSLIPLIILVIGISVSITLLAILGIIYYRRYQQRAIVANEDMVEQEKSERIQHIRATIDTLKKKIQVQAHSLRMKKNGDDEDEDEDEVDGEDDDD